MWDTGIVEEGRWGEAVEVWRCWEFFAIFFAIFLYFFCNIFAIVMLYYCNMIALTVQASDTLSASAPTDSACYLVDRACLYVN